MSRKLKERPSTTQPQHSRDNFKKPLTNEEKFNGLSHHVDQLYKVFGDINSRLIALSRAKLDPKVMADFMRDTEANSNFMKNLNSELDLAAAQEAKKQNEALKSFEVKDDNGPTIQPGGDSAPQRNGGVETELPSA